jgi:hypothetical protein
MLCGESRGVRDIYSCQVSNRGVCLHPCAVYCLQTGLHYISLSDNLSQGTRTCAVTWSVELQDSALSRLKGVA